MYDIAESFNQNINMWTYGKNTGTYAVDVDSEHNLHLDFDLTQQSHNKVVVTVMKAVFVLLRGYFFIPARTAWTAWAMLFDRPGNSGSSGSLTRNIPWIFDIC